MKETRTIVCTGCSILCEDVAVDLDEHGKIKKILGACVLGAEKIKFTSMNERILKPKILKNGKNEEVTFEEAIEETIKILMNSKKPLIYGWSNVSCEAINLGLKIAEKLKGIFDSTASLCQGFSIFTAKKLGMFGATLEEVLDHGDHIIYWGTNPAETFHRHMSKYTVFPRGEKVPKGVENRIISVVDVRETKTVKIAHNKLVIKPGEDLKLVEAIEAWIKGEKMVEKSYAGIPAPRFFSFLRDLKNSRYAVIFYGLGVVSGGKAETNLKALYRLVELLNKVGIKCSAIPMAGHCNMVGAVETTLKATGFPYAIDFSTKPPNHNPQKTSIIPVLMDEKVDSALIVGSDPLAHLPVETAKKLLKIPFIVLDFVESLTMSKATVRIPVTVTGVETGGTAYRMDGKEVKLSPIIKPPEGLKSDEQVLSVLLSKL